MADLQGTTVVLADDHAIVREGFASLCAANGMRVLGQCPDGPSAVETILAREPDFAILDVNLAVESSFPVAHKLHELGIAFIFATGYGESAAPPPNLAYAPVVAKPYRGPRLLTALAEAARLREPPG